jgi:hypothetical protein
MSPPGFWLGSDNETLAKCQGTTIFWGERTLPYHNRTTLSAGKVLGTLNMASSSIITDKWGQDAMGHLEWNIIFV